MEKRTFSNFSFALGLIVSILTAAPGPVPEDWMSKYDGRIKIGLEMELLDRSLIRFVYYFDFDRIQSGVPASEIHPVFYEDYLDNPEAFRALPEGVKAELSKGLQLGSIVVTEIPVTEGVQVESKSLVLENGRGEGRESRPGILGPNGEPAQLRDGIQLQKKETGLKLPPRMDWQILKERWRALPHERKHELVKWGLLSPSSKVVMIHRYTWVRDRLSLKSDAPAFLSRFEIVGDLLGSLEFKHKEPVTSIRQFLGDARAVSELAGVSAAVMRPDLTKRRDSSFQYHLSRDGWDGKEVAHLLNLELFLRRLHQKDFGDLDPNDRFTFNDDVVKKGLLRWIEPGRFESRQHIDALETELKAHLEWMFRDEYEAVEQLQNRVKNLITDEILDRIAATRPEIMRVFAGLVPNQKLGSYWDQFERQLTEAEVSNSPKAIERALMVLGRYPLSDQVGMSRPGMYRKIARHFGHPERVVQFAAVTALQELGKNDNEVANVILEFVEAATDESVRATSLKFIMTEKMNHPRIEAVLLEVLKKQPPEAPLTRDVEVALDLANSRKLRSPELQREAVRLWRESGTQGNRHAVLTQLLIGMRLSDSVAIESVLVAAGPRSSAVRIGDASQILQQIGEMPSTLIEPFLVSFEDFFRVIKDFPSTFAAYEKALSAFAAKHPRDFQAPISRRLESENPQVRQAAMFMLEASGLHRNSPAMSRRVLDALQDSDSLVRRRAYELCDQSALIGSRTIANVLTRITQSGDLPSEVRVDALKRLSENGNRTTPAALELLNQMSKDSDAGVRGYAQGVLGSEMIQCYLRFLRNLKRPDNPAWNR